MLSDRAARTEISQFFKDFGTFFSSVWRGAAVRLRRGPISDPEDLVNFIETRAAYVAQTSLFGYLKTRMGSRYIELFQDAVFSKSVSGAKWRIYAACLSDLVVFSTAVAARDAEVDDAELARFAHFCFDSALANTFTEPELEQLVTGARDSFRTRVGSISWTDAADGENAFVESPRELVEAAPIADELKQHDVEIVSNSIRFRWRDVRDQLRTRADGAAIFRNWDG